MSAQLEPIRPAANDADAQETREWLDALAGVIQAAGGERAHFLLEQLIEEARQRGIDMPFSASTGYVNTIEPEDEERSPGNLELEGRLRAYMRWNAMAMVVKANRLDPADGGDLGGHISSLPRWRTCCAGFNHFWHADSEGHGGDLLYIQGHSAPGIYAAPSWKGASLRSRCSASARSTARACPIPAPEADAGVLAVPHRVDGPGPLMAIYQARFLKYCMRASPTPASARSGCSAAMARWTSGEPGAIGLASREKLDNLIFVVNCNLQRLDGPVRGNGKIVQELEGEFRGAGWNVIKLLWGSNWDPLLARDRDGVLRKLMMDTLDGDYQAFKANDGAFVRKHFFGRDPRTLEMVAKMSDADIWALRRGGHDPAKVYAAFHKANSHQGEPTVLLVKTVKGYGMGGAGEGKNTAHQTKKLSDDDIATSATASTSIPDSELPKIPFYAGRRHAG